MTLYLMDDIPNALMPNTDGVIEITGITATYAKNLLQNNAKTFVSAISHVVAAEMLSKALELNIFSNPIDVQPKSGDIVIAALRMSPRRSSLTEAEIKWVEVSF